MYNERIREISCRPTSHNPHAKQPAVCLYVRRGWCVQNRTHPTTAGSAGRKLDEVIALLPAPKIHNHHIFPQQFRKRFEKAGIEIEKHTIELSEGLHLRGVHGKGGFVGPGNKVIPNDRWNILWSDFFNDNPNPSAKEIYQFAGQLMDTFGLSGLPIVPYK